MCKDTRPTTFYSKFSLANKSHVLTSGEDAGVHERGHAEVGEGEEEDHGNVDGNDREKILRQPRTPGEDGKGHEGRLPFDMQPQSHMDERFLHTFAW